MRKCDKFYKEAMEREKWPEDDLCDPPTDAKTCMDVLIKELLGKGWYVSMSENHQQVLTAATYDILKKYVDTSNKSYTALEIFVVLCAIINIIFFIIR